VFLGFLAERLPNDVISVNNDVGHSYLARIWSDLFSYLSWILFDLYTIVSIIH